MHLMSDTNDPGDTPAGGPPPSQNPYGQNPYGQPPASQQDPYGQPTAPVPAYGHPAYGQTQPGDAASTGGDPDRRPGTVTAAGVVTMVFSGLSLLVFGIMMVLMLVAKDEAVGAIEDQPGFENSGISADDALGVVVGIVGVFALWCLIALILGYLVLRRSNGARITLVVSSAVTALISLLLIGSGVSALTLIASIAVIVLLLVGGAGDWFKRTDATTGPGLQQS